VVRRRVFTRQAFAVVLSLAALGVSSGSAPAAPANRVIEVAGFAQGPAPGTAERVDIMLDVPPGADATAVAADALRRAHATPWSQTGPTPDFNQSCVGSVCLRWPQFFDHDRTNNFVAQLYNPAGDPTGGGAAALQAGEATWSGVDSSTFRIGLTGTTTTSVDAIDGQNIVLWSPADTSFRCGPSALACTITSFERSTGFIVDSDVLVNSAFPWSADAAGPPPSAYDLQTALTHEDGHVAGLDHVTDPTSVMYPFLAPGETRRTLSQDDVDGISTVYPLHFHPIHPPAPSHPVASPQGPPPGLGVIARLGDPAPGGGVYDPGGDIEPYTLTGRGQAMYAAEFFDPASFVGGEGAYVASGTPALAARTGQPAPGGGTFGAGVLFGVAGNDGGDAAFTFALEPFTFPVGVNAGLYRYSGRDGSLDAVVVPGVTPAPGGGVFAGAFEHPDLNDAGDIAFAGLVPTSAGISGALGIGIYGATPDGSITRLVAPGDPAPGSGTFDLADMPAINARGDVAFGGHVHGEPCLTSSRQTIEIHCDEGLYLRRASGQIAQLVHAGDPAPGGGAFRSVEYPRINLAGDVLFVGDVTPPPGRHIDVGVYLYRNGTIMRVAAPGDPLPGGGNLVHAYPLASLTATGTVAFASELDSDTLGFGFDTGAYTWANGKLRLVARTGSSLPGLGVLDELDFPAVAVNDAGRVLFSVFASSEQGDVVALIEATG
jgi:Matrixin